MSKILTLILASFLCSFSIQAQTTQPTDTLELETVVVTASKIPLSLRETTKSVTILNKTDIEQSGATNIGQLLNSQPGITVNNAGGNPTAIQGLYLQGATGQYTLVLIDGIAISDPAGSGGAYDLRLLSLENVEQIEIVKGSQSTLYGTDAIAGVVNIITKKSSKNLYDAMGSIAYGSFNSFDANLGVNGTVDEKISYAISYTHNSSNGISEAEEPNDTVSFDKDGFNKDALFIKLGISPIEGLEIRPFLNFSSMDGDFDGGSFTDASSTYELNSINPGAQFSYTNGILSINGGYHYMNTKQDFAYDFGPFNLEGRLHNSDIFGTISVTENFTVLGGLNYQKSILPESTNGTEESAMIASPYGTFYIKDFNGLNAEIGTRLNLHSEYGANATFSIASSLNVGENSKLLASVGTGFKAPTLTELYSAGSYGGNPELDPQRSFSAEGGFELRLLDNTFFMNTNGFYRSIEDVIIFQYDPDSFNTDFFFYEAGSYFNINEQIFYGFEIASRYFISSFGELKANYTFMEGTTDGEDILGNTVDNSTLIRRPKHQFGFGITINSIENLFVTYSMDFVGERPDTDFSTENTTMLDSYTLANIHTEYRLLENNVSVFGSINNLFDTNYIETYGYSTLGINAKLGVRLNLN